MGPSCPVRKRARCPPAPRAALRLAASITNTTGQPGHPRAFSSGPRTARAWHHSGMRSRAPMAVLRAAQRRDRPAADGLHPLAARRQRDHGRLAAGPGPRHYLPAGRACTQDRHRVQQTGRPDPGPGHRRLAGHPPRQAELRRTTHRRDRRSALRHQSPAICAAYINNTVIPVLCRKAGVPAADVRGNITSHRPVHIASQLYNAKEPMTLFELQAWLGHRSPLHPVSTPRSAPHADPGLRRRRATSPATCAPSRYWSTATPSPPAPRGRRALAALRPRPRLLHLHLLRAVPTPMACAKCDFYTSKDSSKAQLLEAKETSGRWGDARYRGRAAAVDDGRPPSTGCWTGSPTSPRRPGRRPGNSTFQPAPPSSPIVDVRQAQAAPI